MDVGTTLDLPRDGRRRAASARVVVTVTPQNEDDHGHRGAGRPRPGHGGDGAVVEDTHDWYAQDADGNIWYFGEDTKEYEHGKVKTTEGSWEAGVDGARAGRRRPREP